MMPSTQGYSEGLTHLPWVPQGFQDTAAAASLGPNSRCDLKVPLLVLFGCVFSVVGALIWLLKKENKGTTHEFWGPIPEKGPHFRFVNDGMFVFVFTNGYVDPKSTPFIAGGAGRSRGRGKQSRPFSRGRSCAPIVRPFDGLICLLNICTGLPIFPLLVVWRITSWSRDT